MGNQWDADVDLGPERATSLIEAQFPDLAPVRIATLGQGWDNAAYLVNDTLVFRFPRRRIAAEFLSAEALVLPKLAGLLSTSVPEPSLFGEAAMDYPYPFLGYRKLAGTTACSVALDDGDRAALAAPLAAFLAALHGLPVAGPLGEGAPGDLIGRTDLPRRSERIFATLERIEERVDFDVDAVRETLRELARTDRWTGAPALVHGDLYARHILVDDDKALAGVIDWGDVHLGDPALDIGIAWSFLPAAARPAFRQAYGAIDDDTWARARFKGLSYAAFLIEYGLSEGDDAMLDAGRHAVAFGMER